LVASIESLEKSGLSVEAQIKILDNVEKEVTSLNKYSERLCSILVRNPDILFFRSFNIVKAPICEKIYSFVPLTTVDVERTFSKYKEILSDKRTNLAMEFLEKLLFLYYNKNL
jgi:hypothetical protein